MSRITRLNMTMNRNSMEKLIHLPIYENVIKRYGKYTKKINGELVKVTYDWFEREYGSQYKLSLTKEQYDQIKSIVTPIDFEGKPLTFDQFCDILIPVITGNEDDQHDDYAIWLAFRSFDQNDDGYIQTYELELLMKIIGKSVSQERIRILIDRVDWDENGQLDFNEFRQFIIQGYARDLLTMDITHHIIYSDQRLELPSKKMI